MTFVSRKAFLVVLAGSLSACGAPQLEEGSAPELDSVEQGLTSALSLPSRDSVSGDTTFTLSVSGAVGSVTYFWRFTETQTWSGNVYDSGWYTGAATEHFYCPRQGDRGNELLWHLRVEAYAVDATGASLATYRGIPCSLPK
jgi:hypothetical protein